MPDGKSRRVGTQARGCLKNGSPCGHAEPLCTLCADTAVPGASIGKDSATLLHQSRGAPGPGQGNELCHPEGSC